VRHYPYEDDFSREGNIEYLSSGRSFSKIEPVTILQIKQYLIEHGIDCRFQLQGASGG
jgi:hypothetical protein